MTSLCKDKQIYQSYTAHKPPRKHNGEAHPTHIIRSISATTFISPIANFFTSKGNTTKP